MKTIENIITDIETKNSKKEKFDYFDLIQACLNSSPEKGIKIDEMRKSFKILDIIEATEKPEETEPGKKVKIIELEDADFDFVKKKVIEMDGKWLFAHRDLIVFHDYINTR